MGIIKYAFTKRHLRDNSANCYWGDMHGGVRIFTG